MRSIMLLVVGISLLAACVGGTDAPKFSPGQAISVVQSNLGNYGCSESHVKKMVQGVRYYGESYEGGGKWTVTYLHSSFNKWEVFESSMTVRVVKLSC